jgi:branched-chain amino acid transport system ATP-binding protein
VTNASQPSISPVYEVMATHPQPKLVATGLCSGYGRSQVLFGVSLSVPVVGAVAVLGANGAGKTTLAKTLLGYLRPTAGQVLLDGRNVTGAPTRRLARDGVGYVPQEQVVFPTLTVEENLILGRDIRRGKGAELDEAYALFPKLASRRTQLAGTLSGGERKMVSLARALLARPSLLVLDEPTEGVWQGVVEEIVDRLRRYTAQGALLLIEQHVDVALALAEECIVVQRGEVVFSGPTDQMKDSRGLAVHLGPYA